MDLQVCCVDRPSNPDGDSSIMWNSLCPVTVDTRQRRTAQGSLDLAWQKSERRATFTFQQGPLVPFLEKKAVLLGFSALPSVKVRTEVQMFFPLGLSPRGWCNHSQT